MMPILMAAWGLCAFLVVEIFVFLPLYIVGIPVAWCASRWAGTKTVPSRIYPEKEIVAYINPFIDWWVGNWEDGCKPVFDWWPGEKSALQWYLRNPVTQLRFAPILSTRPSPETRSVGSLDATPPDGVPGWFLAWAHGYVGFLYQTTTWGIWLGWKVNPRDARFVRADDYRRAGLGIACQFMRFRAAAAGSPPAEAPEESTPAA